jgi:hypothetical protein
LEFIYISVTIIILLDLQITHKGKRSLDRLIELLEIISRQGVAAVVVFVVGCDLSAVGEVAVAVAVA